MLPVEREPTAENQFPVEEIDRTLVALFDIEGFTTRDPTNQATIIRNFIQILEVEMEELAEDAPVAWSTGDGAIVSIGHHRGLDKKATRRFTNFAIGVTRRLIEAGLIVRTVLNHADKDWHVALPTSSPIRGDFIQIGDGINYAARLMSVCEPREILLSEAYVKWLRKHSLVAEYNLHRNPPFRVKHNELMTTWTYVAPTDDPRLYSPNAVIHPYRALTRLPSVNSDILEFFIELGLDGEIRAAIERPHMLIDALNRRRTFESGSDVMRVLSLLGQDSDEEQLVLSRNDVPGFWTQPRIGEYLGILNRKRGGDRYINQRRVIVYDDGNQPPHSEWRGDDELTRQLVSLHARSTLLKFPASELPAYRLPFGLRYGFTASTKRSVAVIPVPGYAGSATVEVSPRELGRLLDTELRPYRTVDGPMKAVICADAEFVNELIDEMMELMQSIRCEVILD